MNSYKNIYNNLVYSRQNLKEKWKAIGSGLERHRIIPRHQGNHGRNSRRESRRRVLGRQGTHSQLAVY